MCGRFTLRTPANAIATLFDLEHVSELRPRYNVAPSQPIAAVRQNRSRQREFVMLHWGLIPFWADDPKIGYRTINARAETVATKPSFRAAFKKRRCLVIADGYFEWKKRDGKKQPYFFHMNDDRPFAFAGLWEHWEGDDGTIESCTILVTEANARQKPIHDRMPVILSPQDYDAWLDPDVDGKRVEPLLRPYPHDDLDTYPVSTTVNKPQNDVEECVQPAENTESET